MKYNLYFLLGLLAIISCSEGDQASGDNRPNIILLLADDLGYGELGCYGQEMIETPVIDELANQGMRFTDFYAGSAVCSPSRAVLMSGISSSYNEVRGNKGYYADRGEFDRVPLPVSDTTVAEMLKGAGYQTILVGKWHLDHPDQLETWAHARGFDYAIQEQWGTNQDGFVFDEHMHLINGLDDSIYYNVNDWECLDDFRTHLALKILDSLNTEIPFFLFMSYRAPHGHERVISNQTLYANKGWPEKERHHAAKITLLDQQVGRLMDKLEDMGELQQSLIVFTSDNGPHGEGGHDFEFFNSNRELKGFKRDMYEGGIRVPCIVVWPGEVSQQVENHSIGGFQDFMATFADIAGVSCPDASTGRSLLPVFRGSGTQAPSFVNWEFQRVGEKPNNFRQAVRLGQLKAIRYGVDSSIELYDLTSDIQEQHNIANDHPAIIQKVSKIMLEQRSENSHFPYGGIIKK